MKACQLSCMALPYFASVQSKKSSLTFLHMFGLGKHGLVFSVLMFGFWLSGAQVRVIVESLPSSTPGSDTIFITGDFNNWVVNDPHYMLEQQLDGRLSYVFPIANSPIEYKFTRGSWMKVETNTENEYVPNRLILPGEQPRTIHVNIANWQDLGGARPIRIVTFYYFSVALIGLLLLFFVHRTKKSDPIKRLTFTCITLFLVFVFSAALLGQMANIIWLTYIEMVLQVLVLAWGPMVYLFLKAYDSNPFYKKYLWLFLPSVLMAVLAFLEIYNSDLVLFMNFRWKGLIAGNIIIALMSMIYSASFLWTAARKAFGSSPDWQKGHQSFIRWYIGLNVFLWMLFATYLMGYIHHISFVITYKHDLVLIPTSMLIFMKMYHLWKSPEILSERSSPAPPIPSDLQGQLDKLMEETQVFKNPDLNMADLSELLNTKPHILSRMLNENYHKNFRDYLNGYRVEAFIKLAEEGYLEKYTFLALAHEVGFNSKSTFNLAFKKQTNQSPRSYFKLKSKDESD